MKSKEQLKQEYAQSKGFTTWNDAMSDFSRAKSFALIELLNEFIDGYQELCCNEVATGSLEKAYDNYRIQKDIWGDASLVKDSITSPDNIVKL